MNSGMRKNDHKQLVQEKAFRTIFLWLIWASTALVIHFALYFDTNLVDYIKDDKSRITWIIMALFILGIAISFSLAVTITEEALRASQLGGIARNHGLHGLNPNKTNRAVDRFFNSLKEIVKNNDQPNIESLIDIEFASYYRTSNSVEMVGNLLITLGLIGTVVGLSITLTGLTTSLDALGHDETRLLAGLRQAMGGMGTAFYTTLLGSVLGGVLLRIFALITDHGIEGLSEVVKRICTVYCTADLKPTLERDVQLLNKEITLLGENVRALQSAMHESMQSMLEFRQVAQQLSRLGEEDQDKATLRDSVVLQHYYSDLLKEEIRVMNKINRSWWTRLRRSMDSARSRKE